MAILVDAHTRVLVQGITGRIGAVQTGHMLRAGTRIVAGVTPGKGGESVEGVPVYDAVEEACRVHGADASIVFVPPFAAEDSCFEAIEAGVRLIVLITEHIPVHSTMRIRACARANGAVVIGPTTPGIIAPGRTKIGIMPTALFSPGPVGVVSRSGTLTYEIAGEMGQIGIGQSTAVGIGADPVVGTDLTEFLGWFEADRETEAIVVIGEVGGSQEERAARFVAERMSKPVVAYIAGRSAPQGVRMGHAGAIVQGGMGSAEGKVRALREAGARVAEGPAEVATLVAEVLG